MGDHAPSEGYCVFIGAYDDDFHSFTVILNKSNSGNTFTFIDQFKTKTFISELFDTLLLDDVKRFGSRDPFPLFLELYQLRNNGN